MSSTNIVYQLRREQKKILTGVIVPRTMIPQHENVAATQSAKLVMCISKMKQYSSGYPLKLKQCVKHEPTPSAIIIRYFCTPSGVFPCFKVNVMLRLSIEDLNLVKKYKMYFLFMIYQFFEKKKFKCVNFWLF